ncbi:hypothetical protein ACFVAV_10400 [Nocardia sp. NPDC057663]|uniref:hypothetical protein n=1 Tax=Nocardia sp. NPDC057663 TaxID=3346201 RepID=UPI00366AACC3
MYPIHNDEKFVLDLFLQEKLHIVQGTGFNWARPDHFRIVTLPHARRTRSHHANASAASWRPTVTT